MEKRGTEQRNLYIKRSKNIPKKCLRKRVTPLPPGGRRKLSLPPPPFFQIYEKKFGIRKIWRPFPRKIHLPPSFRWAYSPWVIHRLPSIAVCVGLQSSSAIPISKSLSRYIGFTIGEAFRLQPPNLSSFWNKAFRRFGVFSNIIMDARWFTVHSLVVAHNRPISYVRWHPRSYVCHWFSLPRPMSFRFAVYVNIYILRPPFLIRKPNCHGTFLRTVFPHIKDKPHWNNLPSDHKAY